MNVNLSQIKLAQVKSVILPTTGDDNQFLDIVGLTISLTIPEALMTVNAGNPDGDIQVLQANNTVNITTV